MEADFPDALPELALLRVAATDPPPDTVVYSTSAITDITSTASRSWLISRQTYSFDGDDATTTVAGTIDSDTVGFGYGLKAPTGNEYPTASNEGGLYVSSGGMPVSLTASYPVVYPIRSDNSLTRSGTFKLIVDTSNQNETWEGVKAYAYKRTAATIPANSIKKSSKLTLKVNPILAWMTNSISDADQTRYWNLVNDNKTLIAKYFNTGSKCSIDIVWATESTQEYALISPLVAQLTDPVVAYILQTLGRADSLNVIWTPSFASPSGDGLRGISGCIGGVPLPLNKEFGCLVSIDASQEMYGGVTASAIQYTTVHEMGHVLGLTHASAGSSASNLMAPAPSIASAMTLNDDQRFILKNACLVTEQVTTTARTNITRLKIYVSTTYDWGFGDGPGTDGDVTLTIIGTGFSAKLDKSWWNDFEAGNTDAYQFDLSSAQEFAASAATSMELLFEAQSSWDTNWSCSGLRVEGYCGDTLKFVFVATQVPKVFDNSGFNEEAVTSANTTYY